MMNTRFQFRGLHPINETSDTRVRKQGLNCAAISERRLAFSIFSFHFFFSTSILGNRQACSGQVRTEFHILCHNRRILPCASPCRTSTPPPRLHAVSFVCEAAHDQISRLTLLISLHKRQHTLEQLMRLQLASCVAKGSVDGTLTQFLFCFLLGRQSAELQR